MTCKTRILRDDGCMAGLACRAVMMEQVYPIIRRMRSQELRGRPAGGGMALLALRPECARVEGRLRVTRNASRGRPRVLPVDMATRANQACVRAC